MKKIILLSAMIIFMSPGSYAAGSNSEVLGKIEDSLYGFQYANESVQNRLSRIEKTVYGVSSPSKSENERLAKLSKDVSAESIGHEIPPVEDTFAENPDYIVEEMQETSDVSYPVIDEMEQQIFKQVNKKDNIKMRLSKLEQQTFKKTYDDDLSTRVDRLRAEIKPQSLMENRMAQDANLFYDDDIEPMASNYHLNKYVPPGSFDYDYYNDKNNRLGDYYDNGLPVSSNSYSPKPKKISISGVEKKLFKQSFSNEPTEKRLSRIENTMFGTEFSNDDTQTRIDRISSAYYAEKSAGKYDSNKFSQNLATAMQIGTLILMVLACIL